MMHVTGMRFAYIFRRGEKHEAKKSGSTDGWRRPRIGPKMGVGLNEE